MKTLITLAVVFWSGALQAKSTTNPGIVEVAPLKGALGQISLRGEFPVVGRYSAGILIEKLSKSGERKDMKDAYRAIGVSGIYYPLASSFSGFFVGAGLRFETERLGRERTADYVTNVRRYAGETNDRWVNEDSHMGVTGAMGYRFYYDKLLTLSLRYMTDQLIYTSSSVASREIRSYDVDTRSKGRAQTKQEIFLHAGLSFP